MYATISQKIPGLHNYIPYSLCNDCQTGLCLPPPAVGQAISRLDLLPPTLPSHPAGTPSYLELRALREALCYAQSHLAGLWEARGIINPDDGIFATILANQGDREEHPERYRTAPVPAPEPVPVAAAVSTGGDTPQGMSPEAVRQLELQQRMEATAPVGQTPEPDEEIPWWKRLGKKK